MVERLRPMHVLDILIIINDEQCTMNDTTADQGASSKRLTCNGDCILVVVFRRNLGSIGVLAR